MATRREVIVGTAASVVLPGMAPTGTVGPTVLATGLRFPEGPVALAKGDLLVSEIAAGRITRIVPSGAKTEFSRPGGGPNGLAVGPDGALYSCNNGGFVWSERGGTLFPGHRATDYAGGRVDRIDPVSGAVTPLYRAVDGVPLSAPNDLVFDAQGGFYFTDSGSSTELYQEYGAVYYARSDGRAIAKVLGGLTAPNGIALSPDGKMLYVALTLERLVLAFRIAAPGKVSPSDPFGARIAADLPGRRYLDSMKVQANGNLCVASLVEGGIREFDTTGKQITFLPIADAIVTNLAFGGPSMQDAWITAGTTGRVYRARWHTPGLQLNFQSRPDG